MPHMSELLHEQNYNVLAAQDVAIQAAREAGHLIRFHAGRIHDHAVSEKNIHDLVTDVDVEAQRVIVSRVLSAFPESHILAEEDDRDAATSIDASAWRWIIDPIDGTTNFTRGIPPYAVSIALERDREVVVGVVYDVAHDELFTAVRGRGFFINGQRGRVNTAATLQTSVLTTGYPYRSFDHIDEYLAVLRTFTQEARGVRRPGAASVDLAYVAAGRFDGFFETGLNPWDVAAGLLLVEEAGGRVTDFFDQPNPVFKNQILATNGHIHQAMLKTLEPLKVVSANRSGT